MSFTFTKLFSSITESTIWVESDQTRIVWITMLAMSDRKGRVWGSVPGLANRARVSVDACRAAIACFLGPDPDSRTKLHEGRRIGEIDGGWQLLNYEKYRAIRDEETIKESKRNYINARRAKGRGVENVEQSRPQSSQAEAEAEAEAEAGKAIDPKAIDPSETPPAPIPKYNTNTIQRGFHPPSPCDVEKYSAEIGYPLNGQAWCDKYEQKGWMIGKSKMKSWKAAVRNWKASGWQINGTQLTPEQKELISISKDSVRTTGWGQGGEKL